MGFLDKVFEAGIVGCGGAGFPTHIKLKTTVEYLIINGAECEPLLRTDRYIMRHHAEELLTACDLTGKEVGASHVVIGLKETYTEEIKALEAAKKKLDSNVEIFSLKNFYPAGDEQVLVYEVTGRVVPPAGLPSDVGAVVSNVASMRAIYDANKDVSFTQKYLTVTGAVKHPIIISAPLGTSIAECIKAAEPEFEHYDFILGGPLMGRLCEGSEAMTEVVTKTTSGVILLPKDSKISNKKELSAETMIKQAKSACIQCSYCTQMCPRHMLGHPLQPHKIMRKLAFNNMEEILDDADVKNALICSECGICEEYACPMGLAPRRINKMIKGIYAKEGIRYQRTQIEFISDEMRDYRRVPSKRIAGRLEVAQYYNYNIDDLVVLEPKKVEIPVKQHIGAPSKPVVAEGDSVIVGQKIAECSSGTLGANIHASICGTVKMVTDRIIIER
jgi:Na+-translocating ferredoxin:NAD+ oxidoreductase RnfC subunit